MDKEFIKSKLLELQGFHDVTYLDKYIDFCILNHDPDLIKGANHHILSRTIFPDYENFKESNWNLSRLTHHNHYIAHALLFKSINHITIGYAWYGMNNKDFVSDKDIPIELIGPELYEELILKRNKICSENSKNKVMAKDLTTGITIKVTKEEFDSNTDLVGHTYKMLLAKNKITGERVYITKEEFDSNDDFVGLTKNIPQPHKIGMFAAKDECGNTYYISKTDERYISGELTAINKGRKFGEEFGKKISELRKTLGDSIGYRNPSANIIIIFDDKNEPIYISHGNFIQMCEDNKLSCQLLARTYTNNTKLYDYADEEYMKNSKKYVITKLINSDLYKTYNGWYARKMERIKI